MLWEVKGRRVAVTVRNNQHLFSTYMSQPIVCVSRLLNPCLWMEAEST